MMLLKEKIQLCENCKTGKISFELDRNSEFCPYIDCYEENHCAFFRPNNLMGYMRKNSFLEKLISFFKNN